MVERHSSAMRMVLCDAREHKTVYNYPSRRRSSRTSRTPTQLRTIQVKLYIPVTVLLLCMSLTLIVMPRLDTPAGGTRGVACADCPLEDQGPHSPVPQTTNAIEFDEADDDETRIDAESYRRLLAHSAQPQQIQTFHEDDIESLLHRPPIH